MESVGEKLRQARLRRELTLDDINASTRISVRNLQAIENDDLSRISSAFFYKSFVRQFAERLGLEYGDLAEAVQDCVSAIPEPAMPGHIEASLPKIPPLQAIRPKNFRWMFCVVALIAVLTGCSSLYAMWENSRYEFQASVSSFVKSFAQDSKRAPARETLTATKRAPAALPSAKVPLNPQKSPVVPDAAGEQAEASASSPESDSGFRVEVAAIERTWLSIVADDKPVYNGVLEAAERKVLEGHDNASIRMGNAGGVSVLFNGKTIGSLGPRGQVRTVLFTKDNFEIVQPPAHIALTSFSQTGE